MKGSRTTNRSVRKKAIDSGSDPYLKDTSPVDLAECRICGAVYYKKRWSMKKMLAETVVAKGKTTVICPACRKVRDKFVGGFVTIKGGFAKAHKDEILRLVKNKEGIAMRYNPLDRIIEIKEKGDSMEVFTTTEKLAQRIGRMLHKTFGGEVEYKWSESNLARVSWSREAGVPPWAAVAP
ncbi:MAG: ATPase [Deltaproteobacteria bacterium]|nr:ATPase [Deltaproteobacteria bacterium]